VGEADENGPDWNVGRVVKGTNGQLAKVESKRKQTKESK
jgi:hypothetical protein